VAGQVSVYTYDYSIGGVKWLKNNTTGEFYSAWQNNLIFGTSVGSAGDPHTFTFNVPPPGGTGDWFTLPPNPSDTITRVRFHAAATGYTTTKIFQITTDHYKKVDDGSGNIVFVGPLEIPMNDMEFDAYQSASPFSHMWSEIIPITSTGYSSLHTVGFYDRYQATKDVVVEPGQDKTIQLEVPYAVTRYYDTYKLEMPEDHPTWSPYFDENSINRFNMHYNSSLGLYAATSWDPQLKLVMKGTTGIIKGTVLDASTGNPILGATVTLWRSENPPISIPS